uniref:Uncharacterized protein n=1 Tax=Anguilla anguilla TaxID=7936 RepID=A0A0E9QKY6_ANGAN
MDPSGYLISQLNIPPVPQYLGCRLK